MLLLNIPLESMTLFAAFCKTQDAERWIEGMV